jgi:N-acetyl-anhydromuramyl-L-alanine amidase AmpD
MIKQIANTAVQNHQYIDTKKTIEQHHAETKALFASWEREERINNRIIGAMIVISPFAIVALRYLIGATA